MADRSDAWRVSRGGAKAQADSSRREILEYLFLTAFVGALAIGAMRPVTKHVAYRFREISNVIASLDLQP